MGMEQFANGSSWVHRLDPRIKIVLTLLFSVVVALDNRLEVAAISLFVPVMLIIGARLSSMAVLGRMAIVNGFVLFLWLFIPFSTPGETILTIGPLSVQQEGIRHALLITVKSNSIALMGIAMLGTSPIFSLVHALSHLHVPDKIVHLFFFCFRYVHVIKDEYQKLMNAMKMRGFRPGTNIHTYRAYSYLVGMLLIRSFDRSKRIMQAMKCRGFKSRFYILHHYEMRTCDYAVALSGVVFSVCMLVSR